MVEIFEELSAETELLAKAVASMNTEEWRKRSNIMGIFWRP